jgi:hypothetical protein
MTTSESLVSMTGRRQAGPLGTVRGIARRWTSWKEGIGERRSPAGRAIWTLDRPLAPEHAVAHLEGGDVTADRSNAPGNSLPSTVTRGLRRPMKNLQKKGLATGCATTRDPNHLGRAVGGAHRRLHGQTTATGPTADGIAWTVQEPGELQPAEGP